MIRRDDLVNFIYSYFGHEEIQKAQKIDTHGANGLQVKGNENITGIALGVTADLEFFQKAVKENYNLLIVHHGLRLSEVNFSINEILKNRLKFLFNNNLTLMGFHYLLDSHPKIGNNAVVLKKLNATIEKPFFDTWGWSGKFTKPINIDNVINQLFKIYSCQAKSFLYGKKEIKTIAICSGGGFLAPYDQNTEEVFQGIDLYVTGIATDLTQAICKEGNINYLAFGHYSTEVIGIKALGEVIQKEFPKLPVKFIDIPNPL